MEFQGVVLVSIRDEDEVYFDMDEIDVICRTLNEIISHGGYPHTSGPNLSINIRPLSETISC